MNPVSSDHPPMAVPDLDAAIARYQTALAVLLPPRETAPDPPLPAKELTDGDRLEILLARDSVQAALADSHQTTGAQFLLIRQLDDCLKQQTAEIAASPHLADWRTDRQPPAIAWWWFLTVEQPVAWHDRWNWLWQGVSITCLTISLGLVGDLSTRFLSGGPDTLGALTVSVQSVLTLLTAGGALTQTGREAGKRLLQRLQVNDRYWQEVGAGLSILLVTGLIGLRLSLPQIANRYTQWGSQRYTSGDWGSAEAYLLRAIALNPDNAEAHFQLGRLYEDLQTPDKAKSHYLIALQGGTIAAANNLARLQILDKQYGSAVTLLIKAQEDAGKTPPEPEIQHALLKNLGWVRFQQGNYPEAEAHLLDAIDLQRAYPQQIPNPASPHCLLAQVMEAQGAKSQARPEWETCLSQALRFIPEEDQWATIAQKRLTPGANAPKPTKPKP